MSQEAFLADIIAHPDDDAPRLVYADWLEDHGEPARAEFIRVQIEMERPDIDPRRLAILQNRERALERRHGKAWRAFMPRWARKSSEFRRGFVTVLYGTARLFLRDGPRLLEQAPITELGLGDVQSCRRALFASPLLGRITSLSVGYGNLDREGMSYLAACPHLGRLRWLDLGRNDDLDQDAIRMLVGAPWLGNLSSLVLWGCPLGDEGAEVLAGSPLVGRLTSLDLGNTHLQAGGVQALMNSSHL
jgi:uncharacterized protein (TIGR02996 family)